MMLLLLYTRVRWGRGLSEEEELGDDRDESRHGDLLHVQRKLPEAGWCGNAIISRGFPTSPFL
jgi:hypothetical protein